MTSFIEEVRRLAPLLRDSDEKNRDFREHIATRSEETEWEAFKNTQAYKSKLNAFWEAQNRLEAVAELITSQIRAGSQDGLLGALAFLSIRQKPFRSGYMSQKLARAVKKAHLGEEEKGILRQVLLDRMTWPWSQPRDLWKLVRRVRTPDFELVLHSMSSHERSYVRVRSLEAIGQLSSNEGTSGRSSSS